MSYNSVEELALDSGGNVWVGQNGMFYMTDTLDGALLSVSADGKEWIINNPSQSGKSSNSITAIACDKRGYLWVTASADNNRDYSFSIYNKKQWMTFAVVEDDTSRPYYMPDIAVDNSNNIWFATDHGVLMLKQDSSAIDAMFSSGAKASKVRQIPHKNQTIKRQFDLLGRKCPYLSRNNGKQPSMVTIEFRKTSAKIILNTNDRHTLQQ